MTTSSFDTIEPYDWKNLTDMDKDHIRNFVETSNPDDVVLFQGYYSNGVLWLSHSRRLSLAEYVEYKCNGGEHIYSTQDEWRRKWKN